MYISRLIMYHVSEKSQWDFRTDTEFADVACGDGFEVQAHKPKQALFSKIFLWVTRS